MHLPGEPGAEHHVEEHEHDDMEANQFPVLEDAYGDVDDDEELDKDMSKWLLIQGTDSESDDEPVPGFKVGYTRVRVMESRPEYKRLMDMGLAGRPAGCTLGIHPSARVWRSGCEGSPHFSRSYEGSSGRTAWQALLLVVELMLQSHVDKNPSDKLAKKQLLRVRALGEEEPKHPD